MNPMRALLRLALRGVRANPGRALLIAALVALPVAFGVFVATLARSNSVPINDWTPRAQLLAGESALVVHSAWMHEDGADPAVLNLLLETDVEETLRNPSVGQLDQGASTLFRRSLPASAVVTRNVQVRLWGSRASLHFDDLDLDHPLSRGRYELLSGRAQQAPNEVLLSRSAMTLLDAELERRVVIPGLGERLVAGTVRARHDHDGHFIVVPPGELDPLMERIDVTITYRSDALPTQASADVHALVLDRSTADRLTASGPTADGAIDPANRPEQLSTLATGTALILIGFVAAAAFSIGARRRLHDVGLLGAVGTSASQVRAVLLVEAAVLGGLGAALGTGVGYGAFRLSLPLVERVNDRDVVPDFAAVDVVGPGALAIVAALGAAWWPAKNLSRTAIAAALNGRIPLAAPRAYGRRGLALLTLGLVGLAIVASSNRNQSLGDDDLALGVAFGLMTLIGAVAATAPIVAHTARWTDRVGPIARLAIRDSERQRTRTMAGAGALIVIFTIASAATTAMASNQKEQDAWQRSTAFVDGGADALGTSVSIQTHGRDEDRNDLAIGATAQRVLQLLPVELRERPDNVPEEHWGLEFRAAEPLSAAVVDRAWLELVDADLHQGTSMSSGFWWSGWSAQVDNGLTAAAEQGVVGAVAFVGSLIVLVLVMALMAGESEEDVRRLVAAGAPPSLRRRLLGTQTLFLGWLAVAMSVPLGMLVTKVMRAGDQAFAVPWVGIGLLVATPVAIALLLAAVFRSAVPVAHRPT